MKRGVAQQALARDPVERGRAHRTQWASEASLVAAFERITDALGGDSLTFFEYNTLAALLVFETAAPDALVLEVGLGGRLDAVNVVDADVAVVVSVGLDHTDWLGPDVESIGREKAGIRHQGLWLVFLVCMYWIVGREASDGASQAIRRTCGIGMACFPRCWYCWSQSGCRKSCRSPSVRNAKAAAVSSLT